MVPTAFITGIRIGQFAAYKILFAVSSAGIFIYKAVSVMAVCQYADIDPFRHIFINAFFAVQRNLAGGTANAVGFVFAAGAYALPFCGIPFGFRVARAAGGVAGIAFACILCCVFGIITFVNFARGVVPRFPLAGIAASSGHCSFFAFRARR